MDVSQNHCDSTPEHCKNLHCETHHAELGTGVSCTECGESFESVALSMEHAHLFTIPVTETPEVLFIFDLPTAPVLKTPEVLFVFERCIHVGVWHSSSLLESKEVTAAIKATAKGWAKENNVTLGACVSSGWNLGTGVSQTRLIFTIE